jgi:hypothetical protein
MIPAIAPPNSRIPRSASYVVQGVMNFFNMVTPLS